MASQTITMSAVESVAQVAIGYGLSVLTQIVVFPWFGFRATFHENLAIAGVFTVVSVARLFAVRRLFASFCHRR